MTQQLASWLQFENGVTILALGEEFENIDEQTLETFRDAIDSAAENADPPRLLIDLSHTKFFGSSFIAVLFRIWKRLRDKPGCRFAICGMSKYCHQVLVVTHVDTLWQIYPDRSSAMAGFSG